MPSVRIGKSQARASLLPLLRTVAAGGGPVEITDRGKVQAVLLGYGEYQRLQACAAEAPVSSPVGALEIVGDLDEGSREVSAALQRSVQRTGSSL